MAAPRQIGESKEVQLLQKILRQLERMTSVVSKIGVTTTTTTTTAAP